MAAKTPQQYNGGIGSSSSSNGQPHAPSSSLGTTAVNRNSYHDLPLHPLSHNTHAPKSGPSFVDPAASSSDARHHPQNSYAAQPLSTPDGHNIQNYPYQQQLEYDQYGETESNTLTNSNQLHAPVPVRHATGKFKEEWDASQRGSSIIDSPLPRHIQNHNNNMSSIHRSSSFSGSTTGRGGDLDGASSIQVSRNNTLKKKSSLRRSGSLGRSGSRRSMKAGSVRSLALQSNADEDELHSAFYCPVPTKGNPTEALANRFQGAF